MTVRARLRDTSSGSARDPSGSGSVQNEHSLSKSKKRIAQAMRAYTDHIDPHSAESGSMGNDEQWCVMQIMRSLSRIKREKGVW